ncbi:MAG TPA: FAD-binding oxidoreductase, partial [Zeimonas sp.]
LTPGEAPAAAGAAIEARVRPGEPGWPDAAQWQRLARQVGDAFLTVRSPLADCAAAPDEDKCDALFASMKNPYFLRDEVGLTQSLGWVDAWTSRPSVHAVAARTAKDVAAAVDFAREHRLRLVVKGGGHSYHGGSCAPDSLLVWTRRLDAIEMHDAFVPSGCGGRVAPSRAVTVGAGAIWSEVYDAVTTRGGGYVQGGGCLTVGVAGLVQSGGFGSFSKRFGLAASSLLEAEVVTADGAIRTANACTDPDLFWALKGGGGGSFGVVTRLTLRVHPLPETFGAVNFVVRAKSPPAFRRLVALVVDFCASSLLDPHWGEQIRVRPDDAVQVSMVFQGLDRPRAQAVWQPFLDAVDAASGDFSIDFSPLKFVATSARTFWEPSLFKRALGFQRADDRPGAPRGNVYWSGDEAQVGQFLHGFGSAWLPASLLRAERRPVLVDALVAASRRVGVSLHLNKGLAGAPQDVVDAARDTATNPVVLDAFALAISGAAEQPAYPGVPGREPDVERARERRQAIADAMGELRRAGARGSYVSESDWFERDWQRAYWGENHERLMAVKAKYDPQDLFVVHHGVGSERWSEDGFTRLRP